MRNPFEQSLIEPLVRVLEDKAKYGLTAEDGLGVVVPHRAQRAALQAAFPELCIIDAFNLSWAVYRPPVGWPKHVNSNAT